VQAGAVHIVMLIVGRIFLGAGIGLANQVSRRKMAYNSTAYIVCDLLRPHALKCCCMTDRAPPLQTPCEGHDSRVLLMQTAPLYISEIAPPKSRGALNIMFQLSTTAGILVASGINYGTQYT